MLAYGSRAGRYFVLYRDEKGAEREEESDNGISTNSHRLPILIDVPYRRSLRQKPSGIIAIANRVVKPFSQGNARSHGSLTHRKPRHYRVSDATPKYAGVKQFTTGRAGLE
jgi:hypothetical protein